MRAPLAPVFAWVVSALLTCACAVPRSFAPTPVHDALSAFTIWANVPVDPGTSVDAAPVDLVRARGGDVVRLVVEGSAPVEIGQRVRSGSALAESWSTMAPRQGVVTVRAMAFATAILARRGVVIRAHKGHASDPGYYWFGLEDRVLEWAAGPIPAPFPGIAPRQRIDGEGFAELDRALAQSVAAAADRAQAAEAARAVRRVAGLRAVRALRPPSGFPYFSDTRPAASRVGGVGAAPGTDTLTYEILPGRSVDIPAEGPATLHLFATLETPRPDGTVELRVLEGDRLRGSTGPTVPRAPLTSTDPTAFATDPSRPLRRAVVHVPPGRHVYRVESTARALIVPLISRAVIHVEDASVKDEGVQLGVARRACAGTGAPAICAMALALAGEDLRAAPSRSFELGYEAAFSVATPLARRVTESLGRGGPRDPLLALEGAASRGEPRALEALGALLRDSVDEATRAAWSHALSSGTEWTIAPAAPAQPATANGENWTALVYASAAEGTTCVSQGEDGRAEVGDVEAEFATTLWHGVPVLTLLVAAPCDEPAPVELLIDGERVAANPSGRLVRWHVRVRGATARVRRVDPGRARVYALPPQQGTCAARWEASFGAPRVARAAPKLAFGASPESPGVELWLRNGAALAEVKLTSTERRPRDARTVRVIAGRTAGLSAYDEQGTRWTRVARVPLPAWAARGARVEGSGEVAVRAIVRAPRGAPSLPPSARESSEQSAVPLDEAALVTLSRRILAAPAGERGPLYLDRALMLAASGAARGSLADARAAQRLGARGRGGEDAVVLVRASIRRRPVEVDPLPGNVVAYGTEADFDANSRRCEPPGDTPRARLERLVRELPHQPSGSSTAERRGRPYDAALGARALEARELTPLDPRAPGLVARALAGSRWRLKQDLGAAARRVRRPRPGRSESPLDPEGELRPRVAAGGPFDEGTFATILPTRPGEAVLAGIPLGTRVRADVVCVPMEPAEALAARCPLEVRIGNGEPQRPTIGADGRGTVSLSPGGSGRVPLTIGLGNTPGRWVALARIVLDHQVPHATSVGNVGWVLAPARSELRYVVPDGEELILDSQPPGAIRIDALAEDGTPVDVVVESGGRMHRVAADGSPLVVPLPEGGRLTIQVRGGAASVAIAERASKGISGAETSAENADPPKTPPSPAATELRRPPLVLDAGGAQPGGGAWRARAEGSPDPLGPLQASLGTAIAATGAVYGTLRQGSPSASAPDGFVFGIVGYRHRVQPLSLWLNLEAFGRARAGEPTHGASVLLYEELERLHVRLSASLGMVAQRVAGIDARSVSTRAFGEYSFRATRDFFVLPRLGYDRVYTSLPSRPTSLSYVDDEVYSSYRATRPTFLFAQALLWYAPYFNEILYLRLRGSVDPGKAAFSHASVRPGTFLAFGDIDLSGFLDVTWYAPSDSITGTPRIQGTPGMVARYDFWSHLGSLGIQPGVAAFAHMRDGGWQVNVFVNLFASYRRGLRDFSSLELDFPEQRGGGIPWRGAVPGGYQ